MKSRENKSNPVAQLKKIYDILNDGPWNKRIENAPEVLVQIAQTFKAKPTTFGIDYVVIVDNRDAWNVVAEDGCDAMKQVMDEYRKHGVARGVQDLRAIRLKNYLKD